jgi:1-deoxy-D-xylulose-5-phosphate reductoisomerase
MFSENSKTISILGVTGTIGENTLDIIRHNRDAFKLKCITAAYNVEKFIKICLEFEPEYAAILDSSKRHYVEDRLFGKKIKLFFGKDAIVEVASIDVNIGVVGISGIAGLKPTMKLVEVADVIAVANKESIVCGGNFLLNKVSQLNKKLVPVDSEHSALFQTIEFDKINELESIVLTASGGPFLNYDINKLKDVSVKQALDHPTWKMGKKISIDSATMVNKGLEMIEAFNLFQVTYQQIKVIIHPESIIHCLVNFIDGTSKALMSDNDMKKPISYALNFPNRLKSDKAFDLAKYKSLNFLELDLVRFPVINLVYDILQIGESLPIVFNAANEVMVEHFLNGKIKFTDIVDNLTRVINDSKIEKIESMEHIYQIDKVSRQIAKSFIS